MLIITVVILNRDSRIDIILDSHSQTLETYYDILQYNQQVTANVTYEETIALDSFIEIFTAANLAKKNNNNQKLDQLRDKAKALLEQKYSFLRKKGVL